MNKIIISWDNGMAPKKAMAMLLGNGNFPIIWPVESILIEMKNIMLFIQTYEFDNIVFKMATN